MANIGNVDYMSIPAKTDQMRGVGRELNEKMQSMYDKIKELHEFWYGERYNRLVEGFNKIRPSVNNIVELIFTQLPASLDTIANNYSKLDRSMNIRTVSDEKPRIIEELPKMDDTGKFRFISNSVAEVKQEVEAKISKGIELIDEFENIYRTIDWESDAATSYKSVFARLKEEVVTSLNNLKKDFTELMLQAEQDAKLTEDTNTVE